MNCEKIFAFICARFLIRQPHLKLLLGKNISICKWMILYDTIIFPFVSSTKFKLLKTFFSDIPEILWIKEMENLISWFYVGAKDMAGNTTIHSDIYSVFIPACEKYSARLATCLVSTNKSHVVIICSRCPLIPAKILMGISVRGLAYTMYYDRPSPKMSSKSKEVEVSNQLNYSLCVLWS